ncbi:MAG: glycogen synthase GlgA [Clostridia bacterium]|nr:glycogen synthase GlgA [Clostridia bacterium]
MKILFAASECFPFVVTGGLGDVIGALPKALKKLNQNNDVRVVLPLYSDIPQEIKDKISFVKSITVKLSWRNQYCGINMIEIDGIRYYLIDNEYYFKRKGIYGHFDDAERFAFFCKAVFEMLPHIDFIPDVIHAHDWHTALIPIYASLKYKKRAEYSSIRTVFTIHNIQYQGVFSKEIMSDVLDIDSYDLNAVEYDGAINLMKGAIELADAVNTVSPTYAEEIKMPYYAHGLESIINKRSYKISGILNGIDVERYNPWTDAHIVKRYSAKNPDGKKINKAEIQKEFGLPVDENVPVIGIISRLVEHKGFDLVACIIRQLLEENVQVIILGKGDAHYEDFFGTVASQYPQKMSVKIMYDTALASRIYAGADIILMPSKTEPCGLVQMVACRYGSLPIVRATGGLKDSIHDGENGFVFNDYNAHHMLDTINRALAAFDDKDRWNELIQNAMNSDFTWKSSAKKYYELYKK